MKAQAMLGLCGMLVFGGCHAATLYRYVNPQGVVTYQSSPPPSSAHHVHVMHFHGKSQSGGPHGASVAAAPVVLYEAPSCQPCTVAVHYLKTRGVPFRRVDVTSQKALAAMKRKTGSTTVPTIMVGKHILVGYVKSLVSAELTAAGYPKSAKAAHPRTG